MTRPLRVVDAGRPEDVLVALREALSGGPAILPRAAGSGSDGPGSAEHGVVDLPATVPNRVAVVVETSGSTGTPKRVALSANALLAGAAASDSALGGPGHWLLALPAHYIAGINVLVRSIAAGTEPALMGERFDPFAFAFAARTMTRTPAAPRLFTALVPAQLARLMEADELLEVLRGFDRILLGGQAAPAPLLARALELGLNVTRTYGSSETSGGCVYDGIPLAGVHVAVTDGQLELGGPTLAEGYLDDPERTADVFFDRDGIRWFRTGDTGELVDGAVRVTGRLDDVIVSGGVNVSLGAVERLLHSAPELADTVVVAADDERWGQVPVVISARPLDLALLRTLVGDALGPAARPRQVLQVPHLPLLPSGKPDRRALRQLAAASAQPTGDDATPAAGTTPEDSPLA